MDEDILILNQSEDILYMAEHIFEFFVTSVNARHIHQDGDCNQEVIDKIESLRVTEKEIESESNPIWDKLKELKNK